MTISLYEASVLNYLQTIGGMSRFLERGLEHCLEHGLSPEEIVETRVFPDMLPFRYQIQAVVHHSVHAIDALESGVFHPSSNRPNHDYRGLQTLLQEAKETLGKLTPERVNARQGAPVRFETPDLRLPFTAENFVLSFSLPNFYFHATTAYGILRAKGVPLGKRDFMGRVRIERE